MKRSLVKDIEKISKLQNLTLNFTKEGILTPQSNETFKNKTDWYFISEYLILSEEFIREFQDTINWIYISIHQRLKEDLIKEFKDKVYWNHIFKNQTLSENFIRKFNNKTNLSYICKYQKLSEKFRNQFNIKIPDTCWLYSSIDFKLKYIAEHTYYEVEDDKYIIAYKATRKDTRSIHQPYRYKYEVGKEYESNCDHNIDNRWSFGLSAWTKEEALNYYPDGKLLKVKIDVEDIGAITKKDNIIRCKKIKILDIL